MQNAPLLYLIILYKIVMKKLFTLSLLSLVFSCNGSHNSAPKPIPMDQTSETAIFAGGCFWCTEAIFLEIDGVLRVLPGYIGGKTANPTYKEVCSGTTGHAEAIEIVFNPEKVSYQELLEIFFATHDPTTLNRQGNDVGTQYRSEIFYTSPDQQLAAEQYIKLLDDQNTFGKKVVTKVSPATKFYTAEDYHRNYYAQNKDQPYCTYVITPKVEKVRKAYKDKLKQ